MAEEQTSTMKWILENMPLIAIIEGLILVIMGVPDFITWLSDGGNLDRRTIAEVAMVLLCGENLIGSIMSFRLARIKREREAGN